MVKIWQKKYFKLTLLLTSFDASQKLCQRTNLVTNMIKNNYQARNIIIPNADNIFLLKKDDEEMDYEENVFTQEINIIETDSEVETNIFSSDTDSEIEFDPISIETGNDLFDDVIYENATMKVSQFNFLLSLFISRFSLSKKCSKELLKLIYFILPQPNKISKNVDKLYINHDLKKPLKQIVRSGCWKPKLSVDSACDDKDCVYNNNLNIKESGLEVYYLDTSTQLELIIKREAPTILKYAEVSK